VVLSARRTAKLKSIVSSILSLSVVISSGLYQSPPYLQTTEESLSYISLFSRILIPVLQITAVGQGNTTVPRSLENKLTVAA
jgi:hypothetical protein